MTLFDSQYPSTFLKQVLCVCTKSSWLIFQTGYGLFGISLVCYRIYTIWSHVNSLNTNYLLRDISQFDIFNSTKNHSILRETGLLTWLQYIQPIHWKNAEKLNQQSRREPKKAVTGRRTQTKSSLSITKKLHL